MKPKHRLWSAAVAMVVFAAIILYLGVTIVGIIPMIAYAVLFGMAAVGVPTVIAIFGGSMPKILKKALGKLNLVLQMFSLGIGVWVQGRHDDWNPQPARVDGDDIEVWWEGKWKTDVGGRENLSRLGLRPFGIVWAKEAASAKDMRRDPKTIADGGMVKERAGIEGSVPRNADTDEWLFDATVFQRFKDYARSSIVTRAEQQKLRKEATRSGVNRFASVIGTIIGLILGGALGLLMTMG